MRPAEIPVELGRDEAAELARAELAQPEYHVDDPSLLERAASWVWDRAAELLDAAARTVPGGLWGLAVIALVAGALVAVLVWRAGPVRRSGSEGRALFVGRARSAADFRRAADEAAAAGRYADAVRERYRAIVRSLEERTILDERPGRTADEAADEAGRVIPLLAQDLWAASTTFDSVVYGGRPATSTDDRFLRDLDRAVAGSSARALSAGARL